MPEVNCGCIASKVFSRATRPSSLRGSRGMLPQKILKFETLWDMFPGFWGISFLISTSEQHTTTDFVNLLYFLRPVLSIHIDSVREFEQDR